MIRNERRLYKTIMRVNYDEMNEKVLTSMKGTVNNEEVKLDKICYDMISLD